MRNQGLFVIWDERDGGERDVYRRRGGGEVKEYPDVNPLGLVFVDNLIYLIASLKEYGNPLQFLLHRMESVALLEKDVSAPDNFTLQGYIQSGEFSYQLGMSAAS